MGKTYRSNTQDEYITEAEAKKQAKLRKKLTKEERKKRKERDNNYEEDV